MTEADFVPLGRMLLCGEVISDDLTKKLLEMTLSQQQALMHATDSEGKNLLVFLILPLSLIYRTLHEVNQNRISVDSDPAQSVEKLGRTLMEAIFPQIAHSICTGDVVTIRRLAGSMEAAQSLITETKGNEKIIEGERLRDKLFSLVWRRRKNQKRTRRLRMLLPLWLWGFGRLTYVQQCKVFEQIGLSEADIPEQDTLRKFLSSYRISSLVAALGVK